jgi:hypothetical protein
VEATDDVEAFTRKNHEGGAFLAHPVVSNLRQSLQVADFGLAAKLPSDRTHFSGVMHGGWQKVE